MCIIIIIQEHQRLIRMVGGFAPIQLINVRFLESSRKKVIFCEFPTPSLKDLFSTGLETKLVKVQANFAQTPLTVEQKNTSTQG